MKTRDGAKEMLGGQLAGTMRFFFFLINVDSSRLRGSSVQDRSAMLT
jgi:hypothetical protein